MNGQTQKKGLHPLAWVAIGCGLLVVLGLVAITAGGFFVANKAKEFAEDPAKAAEIIIRVNPDFELVETDRDAGTMTVRNVQTGETATFDYSEIQQGKFEVVTEEGTASVGGEEGQVTYEGTDAEGNRTSTTLGAGGADRAPAWVPRYPGATLAGDGAGFSQQSGGQIAGSFGLTTTDGVDEVAAWYREQLTGDGYELNESTMTNQDGQVVMLSGTRGEQNVTASINREAGTDETSIGLVYNGPAE